MNRKVITYSIVEYGKDLFYNEDGQLEGTMLEHMNILSEYIDFVPKLHVSKTFVEGPNMVESGKAKIGSPGAASFL